MELGKYIQRIMALNFLSVKKNMKVIDTRTGDNLKAAKPKEIHRKPH